MTSPEWEAANEDDDDRWTKYEAHTGLQPYAGSSKVAATYHPGDGPVWRDRGVIIANQQARIAELEAACQRLQDDYQGALAERDGARAEVAAVARLAEVAAERAAQDTKWGEQNHPNGTGPGKFWPALFRQDMAASAEVAKLQVDHDAKRGACTYAGILVEEVFEALAEDEPTRLRAELVQVAAVAVAWVEKIDRDERRAALAAEPTPAAEPHAEDGAEFGLISRLTCECCGAGCDCGCVEECPAPSCRKVRPAPVADPDDTKDGQR